VLIVDTGALLAAADRADKDHAACRALLEDDEGPLVTTGLVIAEAAYLICRQLGPAAEAARYSAIIDGDLVVAALERGDWERVRDLVTTYASPPLGGTDASVIALATARRDPRCHARPQAFHRRPPTPRPSVHPLPE